VRVEGRSNSIERIPCLLDCMVDAIDFQPYLNFICDCDYYARWWSQNVLTNMERQQSDPFDFNLYVREVKPLEKENPKSPTLPAIEALNQYVAKKRHVLLVGRPGAGKTKALFRYLLELAEQAKNNPLAKIPVLVRLKDYKLSSDSRYSGIVYLIRQEFVCLSLELEEIERYLFAERKFLLLIDGLNEFTSPELRKDLQQFWDNCRKSQIPIVFTTRLLGYRHLEVETQLEIQPISPEERQRFLKERVSPAKWQQLQGWIDRARQSDYTPFVMWMLAEVCEQVNSSSQLENFSLGEAFREFIRLYQDKLYEEGRISNEDSEAWTFKLKHLASEMLSDETSDNFIVFRNRAINILGSEALLNNLIQHHLLVESRGDGKNRKIEFCHQLLQEYYAAEWLLDRISELSDEQLKYYFLNYLKWTEAIGLMLGLPNVTDKQALTIVELALNEVDLMLGARLAGAVKLNLQEQTVGQIVALDVPMALKVELLGETRSDMVVPIIIGAIEDPDLRWSAAEAFGKIGSASASSGLSRAIQRFGGIGIVRMSTSRELGKNSSPQSLRPLWQKQLNSPNPLISEAIIAIQERCQFYNYAIAQSDPPPPAVQPASSEDILSVLTKIKEVLEAMSESKYNVQTEVFQVIENNYGEVTAKKYASDPAMVEALAAKTTGKPFR
jgi:DNA polymerase III delta prime subunit